MKDVDSPTRTFIINELIVIRTALLLLQHELDPSCAKPITSLAMIFPDHLLELSAWSANAQNTASKTHDEPMKSDQADEEEPNESDDLCVSRQCIIETRPNIALTDQLYCLQHRKGPVEQHNRYLEEQELAKMRDKLREQEEAEK